MKFLKIVVMENKDNAVQFDLKMQVSHPELSDYNNGQVIDALIIYKLGDCVTVDDVHKDRSVNRLFQKSDKVVNIVKIDSFAFIGKDKDGNEQDYKWEQVTLPYLENGNEIPNGIYQNYEQPIYNKTKNPVSDKVVITGYETIDTLSDIIDIYINQMPNQSKYKSNRQSNIDTLLSIINNAKRDRKHFQSHSFGHQSIK
tara:strand:+ start:2331 stop:2927 length:597 start_codon:yes stop_codon:yes gene_type:complete